MCGIGTNVIAGGQIQFALLVSAWPRQFGKHLKGMNKFLAQLEITFRHEPRAWSGKCYHCLTCLAIAWLQAGILQTTDLESTKLNQSRHWSGAGM